ncbi:PAS domain S-box-containing protein [Malonomonas rubra DSM 5091]|uniref:histidine kinase n=1 Tax=Malonomonas rubra DSM 5091 TaxID=1122189 RepID=A0A1M6KZ50_MALRU|nr:ATP-binding protein [Malonomonas rubra]SHJ64228.1 PAS domain S-box-containing protein [Malonomonas rubra DSM 5091]
MQTHKLKFIWLVGFLAWTFVIIGLWYLERQSEKDFIRQMAISEARGSYNKDLVYRRWAATQGGVYVKKSSYTPANPYLAHIPARDVTTTDGMELTLVNPAYMTRQVHELSFGQYGTQGHITSLNPLRPENAPDPWEKSALESFHQGAKEATLQAVIDRKPYQRLMLPMITEEICLKCHAQQGYKLGEIRGGISVSVPLEPYRKAFLGNVYQHSSGMALVWLLGTSFIGYTYRVIRQKLINESTARSRAETSETKFRTFFNELNVGLAVADAKTGELLECNDKLADMVQRPAGELLGKPPSVLHSKDQPEGLTDFFLYHRDCQASETLQERLQRASGEIVDVEIKAQKFNLDNRELMLGMFYDVTERNRVEKAHRQLEEQLYQKHKMEAVGQMAGGMAHNFNNNLSIILGNLELAQLKCRCSEQVQDFLANAKMALMRSRDLIRQVMIYSRTSGSDLRTVPAVDILEETMKLLAPTIPTSVTFKQEVSPLVGRSRIMGDFTRIQEALINLCNNSIQAMNEMGDLTIKLDCVQFNPRDPIAYPDAKAGTYLCFTVSDTGGGFSEAVAEKIFDPFFTTKEAGEGTGMGLATVRGIVDSHNGFIKVSSAIGQGTIIQLYFPEGLEDEDVPLEEQNNAIPRGTGRIMIIDDDEMVLATYQNILEELGYQVTAEPKPLNALKMIEQNADNFDLIMTDQTMPDLTGKDLAQKIKSIRPDLPLILCTGYSSQVSPKDAEQLGISAFCVKPLGREELAQVVKNCIITNRTNA